MNGYRGTADAVYQSLPTVRRHGSSMRHQGQFETLCVMSGDQITAIDLSLVYDYHKECKAVFTVCAMSVPSHEATRFGVIEVDASGRIVGFEEKPQFPKEIPGKPGWSYISLGNYFANLAVLSKYLEEDAVMTSGTEHDFGKNIIPRMVEAGELVFAYDYRDNKIPGQVEHYWRDVGTLRSFLDANMDLVQFEPLINLYNDLWQIWTPADNLAPAKFVSPHPTLRSGDRYVVSGGCIIQGTYMSEVVLGNNVRLYGSELYQSVLFSGVRVGEGGSLRRVIVDEDVSIPPNTRIGYDIEHDRARGLFVDEESSIVVVPKGYVFKVSA